MVGKCKASVSVVVGKEEDSSVLVQNAKQLLLVKKSKDLTYFRQTQPTSPLTVDQEFDHRLHSDKDGERDLERDLSRRSQWFFLRDEE